MLRLLLLLAVAFFSTSICFEVDNTTDTLTVTISPKVWSLLETKASLISNAVTSIKIPDFSGEKKLLRYGIYNGRIEHFSIPKNGVSFKDINNGVHLSMRNVQLRASIRGRAEVGFKLFRKWRRIARFSGDIRVQSQNAHLEVTMNWNDFKFTPKIQIFMDLRIDFTHHLRLLNFFRGFIAKIVVAQVQKHVPKMVEELIITSLNPLLQTAKEKIVAVNLMNLNNFDKHWAMQWVVQKNILRIGLKPKSLSKIILPVEPVKSMICVDANLRDMLLSTLSEQAAMSNRVENTAATTYNIACVNPNFMCDGLQCQFCTDIDVHPASKLNLMESFYSCIPK